MGAAQSQQGEDATAREVQEDSFEATGSIPSPRKLGRHPSPTPGFASPRKHRISPSPTLSGTFSDSWSSVDSDMTKAECASPGLDAPNSRLAHPEPRSEICRESGRHVHAVHDHGIGPTGDPALPPAGTTAESSTRRSTRWRTRSAPSRRLRRESARSIGARSSTGAARASRRRGCSGAPRSSGWSSVGSTTPTSPTPSGTSRVASRATSPRASSRPCAGTRRTLRRRGRGGCRRSRRAERACSTTGCRGCSRRVPLPRWPRPRARALPGEAGQRAGRGMRCGGTAAPHGAECSALGQTP